MGIAMYNSTSPTNMSCSLYIFSDSLGAYIACCAYIIRGRPQMSTPKLLFYCWKFLKQPASSYSLKQFNSSCYCNCRWNRQKKMDMLWLNFFGKYTPVSLLTNFIYLFREFFGNFTINNRFSILTTPYHMVCYLIDAIPISFDFNHIHMVVIFRSFVNQFFLSELANCN